VRFSIEIAVYLENGIRAIVIVAMERFCKRPATLLPKGCAPGSQIFLEPPNYALTVWPRASKFGVIKMWGIAQCFYRASTTTASHGSGGAESTQFETSHMRTQSIYEKQQPNFTRRSNQIWGKFFMRSTTNA